MPSLIYSMTVSLDGYIAGPQGEIDWSTPDDELHLFHNKRVRELGAHLLGRRLYEEMLYWETVDETSAIGGPEVEFAGLWKALPRVVFSRTLQSVKGNARLAEGSLEEEVARLKSESAADIGVGGAGLAASLIELGLIDEYQMFVSPVVIGGGTPYFPELGHRLHLELVEQRTFGSRVVYLSYRPS
jgi:dihydrofolate reductase